MRAGAATTLAGTASFDCDARDAVISFSWTQVPGPVFGISGANTSTPIVSAPPGTAGQSAVFKLIITDKGGLTGSDAVTVNIVSNSPPVADAGSDQTKDEGSLVTLNGTNSSDRDIGDILSFACSQIGGPAASVSSATSAPPTFVAPAISACTPLTFRLTVTDNDALSGSDRKSNSDQEWSWRFRTEQETGKSRYRHTRLASSGHADGYDGFLSGLQEYRHGRFWH